MAIKTPRQPKAATASPPRRVLRPGPVLAPASIKALAMPRRDSGKAWTRNFEHAGKATLSPAPRTKRAAKRAGRELAKPMAAVASDHRRNPAA